jgi:hypothetical protein
MRRGAAAATAAVTATTAGVATALVLLLLVLVVVVRLRALVLRSAALLLGTPPLKHVYVHNTPVLYAPSSVGGPPRALIDVCVGVLLLV